MKATRCSFVRSKIVFKEHLVAFIEIAFVSILSQRLKRLTIDELSA